MHRTSIPNGRRRSFLQLATGCGCIGLTNTCAFGNRSDSDDARSKNRLQHLRSCIFLMHYGGPSHLDTWDMKPDASPEIRGQYTPIATSVPGRFVCEHLPNMSKLVHKLQVVRSMHHKMTNHNAAMYEALIGRVPAGGDKELLGVDRTSDFPSIGSMLTYLNEQGMLPNDSLDSVPLINVALPHVMRNVVELAGQNAGFLGGRYDPLQLTIDPNQANFQCRELSVPAHMTLDRLQHRRELLHTLNERSDPELENYRSRAFQLLNSRTVQHAFQLGGETDAMRDRYGRNELGQSLLLARRLVEAGVRFINVNDRQVNGQDVNWDSHEKIFPRHKQLLTPVDIGLSALIEDLDSKGLLESTLIISMGEFGRTPKINASAGRDHWPNCYHVVLAGGGIVEGSTYGSSDAIGAYPDSQPMTPGDLAATIFWRFGVQTKLPIHDKLGRPFSLADGHPIPELFQV